MNVALIAHDNKKDDMVNLAIAYQNILKHHNLFATGTTGRRIREATGLEVHCFQSGPYGGDQQIGAMVANDEMDLVIFLRDPLTAQPHDPDISALLRICDLVIFLRDPLTAQPHDPDISALLRICDVHNVPLATNLAAAEILVRAIEHGLAEFRPRDRKA